MEEMREEDVVVPSEDPQDATVVDCVLELVWVMITPPDGPGDRRAGLGDESGDTGSRGEEDVDSCGFARVALVHNVF